MDNQIIDYKTSPHILMQVQVPKLSNSGYNLIETEAVPTPPRATCLEKAAAAGIEKGSDDLRSKCKKGMIRLITFQEERKTIENDKFGTTFGCPNSR